ncbi:MAG: hypothetical protein Q9184_005035, partial [Pyrenodesmia sp. 2 TL-2023]
APYDQGLTPEKSEQLHLAQHRGLSTRVTPLEFSVKTGHASVSVEQDDPSQEDTMTTITTNSSKASTSSEELISNSTHTDMDVHSNHADSGGEQDHHISINSDDMLAIIMKKWDKDPAFDFGTFGQRNIYNALYNMGTLDKARMRRLKIGFHRLLASLDDRYADFDGLTLRDG